MQNKINKKKEDPTMLSTEQFLNRAGMVSLALMALQSRFAKALKAEFVPLDLILRSLCQTKTASVLLTGTWPLISVTAKSAQCRMPLAIIASMYSPAKHYNAF